MERLYINTFKLVSPLQIGRRDLVAPEKLNFSTYIVHICTLNSYGLNTDIYSLRLFDNLYKFELCDIINHNK